MNKRLSVPICAVLLCGLLAAAAWLGGGTALLNRPFWMDELHSWLIVSDPDFSHSMSALADGVDFNPPTYFVVARVWSTMITPSEAGLRLLSALCMMASAVVLFNVLSRSFSRTASLVAVVAVFSHRLMIFQAFEARFYALWVLLIMAFCGLLVGVNPVRLRRLRMFTVIVLAALACTVHYFGVLAVAATTLAWFASERRLGRVWLVTGMISLTAVLSVAACFPLLAGQKAALTRATWVSAPSLEATIDFLFGFVAWKALLLTSVIGGICWTVKRNSQSAESGTNHTVEFGQQLPVLGLLSMPLLIVVLSWTIQPALVDRYAIVGLLGLGPIFAVALTHCPQALRLIALGGFLTLFATNVDHCRQSWEHRMNQENQLQAALNELPDGVPVVFEDRISWMPAVYENGYPANWYLADFRDDQLIEDSDLRVIQRDVGIRVSAWYRQFHTRSIEELADVDEFVVVPYNTDSLREGLVYPDGFSQTVIANRLLRMVRQK